MNEDAIVARAFVVEWMVACGVGWLIAQMLLILLNSAFSRLLPSLAIDYVSLSLWVIPIAAAQWLVLREEIDSAYLWAAATFLGNLLSIGVTRLITVLGYDVLRQIPAVDAYLELTRYNNSAQGIVLFVNMIFISLISGAIIGIAQWLGTFGIRERLGGWVAISALGNWLASETSLMLGGLVLAALLYAANSHRDLVSAPLVMEITSFGFSAFLGGLLYGALTGRPLIRFILQHIPTEDESAGDVTEEPSESET